MSACAALRSAKDDWSVELQLLLALCRAIDTPHSQSIFMLAYSGEYEQMLALTADPLNYLEKDSEKFAMDHLVDSLLSKSVYLPLNRDKSRAALDTFSEIELAVEERNRQPRLRAPWLLTLQNEISYLLYREATDQSPEELIELAVRYGRLGPGTSPGIPTHYLRSDKLRFTTSVSPHLRRFASAIKGSLWDGDQCNTVVCSSVKIQTVPKNAKTDRSICVCPVIDMFLQRGLGVHLERMLRRDLIDLRSQTRNQYLASIASRERLATIDLSSASSWFGAYNLYTLLPDELFDCVDLIRPRFKEIDGHTSAYHNFMPMGVGYTFALMSLYFWALVKTVVPKGAHHFCSVYGDDIIVPQKYAAEVVERLTYLGFAVNRKKSFISGLFFESCGHEFFNGEFVTPFFARRSTDTNCAVDYRVQLANALRAWVKRVVPSKKGLFKPIHDALVSRVRAEDRPPVPESFGDVGLVCDVTESGLSPDPEFVKRGFEEYYLIKVLERPPKVVLKVDSFPYLTRLLDMANRESSNVVLEDVTFKTPPFRDIVDKAELASPFFRGEPLKGVFGNIFKSSRHVRWEVGSFRWD